MFPQDKEIFITIIASTALMVFLVAVIVFAVVRFQNKLRKHMQEINELKLDFQKEVLKSQLEKEEQTMHRISQEIHDNIGQLLSVVKLNLSIMQTSSFNEAFREKLNTTAEIVSKAITDLRQLSKSLNSLHLMQIPISMALQNEMNIINNTRQLQANLEVKGEELQFEPQKQLILFRILQEALNNTLKHAKATTLLIQLNYQDEQLLMKVKDNGIGFDNLAINRIKGTGIGNMQYRAGLIGAELNIYSEKNKGTTLSIYAPYNRLLI